MQTILGAGGGAGTELAKELIKYTDQIRIVNRNPKRVNSSDQLMQADLTDASAIDKAVSGSEVVYATIGFEYKLSVWKKEWKKFMTSLVHSSAKYKAKIVFVDNIYMLDKQHLSNMSEDTPINPPCKKGVIRKEVFNILMSAVDRGEVNALVARGADFYGPNVKGSYFTQTVMKNLLNNKNPQWLGNADKIHNFSYSRDIGKALAILGNTSDAFNQVWHLPTTDAKLTSRKWIELFMSEMKMQKKISALPTSLLGVIGMFIPILKEMKDISYQLDNDYFFNSSKFNKRFNFTPTTPEAGVKEIVENTLAQRTFS